MMYHLLYRKEKQYGLSAIFSNIVSVPCIPIHLYTAKTYVNLLELIILNNSWDSWECDCKFEFIIVENLENIEISDIINSLNCKNTLKENDVMTFPTLQKVIDFCKVEINKTGKSAQLRC
jgi:hypothetical protein